MKISELAATADCTVEAVRYYERIGLMNPPERTGSNYRSYNTRHTEQLQFIRQCRLLDLTLDEIRRLLELRDAPLSGCGEVNRLLDQHIVNVHERLAGLQALEKQLIALRACCAQEKAAADCGILHELGRH